MDLYRKAKKRCAVFRDKNSSSMRGLIDRYLMILSTNIARMTNKRGTVIV